MLHSRGRSFILDWISVWSLEDHSTRYGCKLWRVPWTMFWSSCAGGRSCWGTRRLNCGYEDLVISSSTQPTCCTVQRTMSEVSCIDATRSPFFPVITPLALTNKGLIECQRKKKADAGRSVWSCFAMNVMNSSIFGVYLTDTFQI